MREQEYVLLVNSIRKNEFNGRGFTSFVSHPRNSSISYHINGNVDAGFIASMLTRE
jgi:hypothetical protein